MTFALATRDAQGISMIHDRNPIFVRLSDGALRNAYTVASATSAARRREFTLISGLWVDCSTLGRGTPRGRPLRFVDVGPDQTREVRILVHRLSRHAAGRFDPDHVPSLY